MDYFQTQVVLVVFTFLVIVKAQNYAGSRFNSRYNEDSDSNSLRYDVIDEGTQNFNKAPTQNSFHDIYTLKGQAGDIQRIHYAVDDNGPRTNFQSNTVQFQENFASTNNFFGERINIRPPEVPKVLQENHNTRKFKSAEEIKAVPSLGAEVGIYGNPVVFPSSFVSFSPSQSEIQPRPLNVYASQPEIQPRPLNFDAPQFQIQPRPLNFDGPQSQIQPRPLNFDAPQSQIQPRPLSFDERNTQTFENRLSTEYESSPIEQALDSPFIHMDQIYDSQRIPKPMSDDMTRTAPEYFSLSDNVPNSASVYPPLSNNAPIPIYSEYQQDFGNTPLAIHRFNVSEYHNIPLDNQNRKSFASLPLNSAVASEYTNFTPVPLQVQSHEPKSEVSHEIFSKNVNEEPNFEIYQDTNSFEEIIPKTSEINKTTLSQQNMSPTLNSYFTTDVKLSPSLKAVPTFSESLINSPMSTVYDTSKENGKYYHYVMNLGQSPDKGESKIFSTGDALFKLLKETGIPVQPSLKNISNKRIKDSNLKKNAKASGIVSEKIKRINSKKSIAKLMFDLQAASDSINKFNLTEENPSVNLSIPIKFNKKIINVSDKMLIKIHNMLNTDLSSKSPANSTSASYKLESTTPSVATESYTVSPFLADILNIHEELNVPFTDSYQEITTASTQSTLEASNEEDPLFITVPQSPSNLTFVSSHSTTLKSVGETSPSISTLSNESTVTSTLPPQKLSVTEMNLPTTSEPILISKTDISSSTLFEKVSTIVPTNPTLTNLSTVSYEKESTTASSTDTTTLETSISTINDIGNELPTQGNNETLNTIVKVEVGSSKHSLGNSSQGNLVKSMSMESDKPMLELVITTTEMKDFMSKIHNMPIFIRVLNPKHTHEYEKKSAAEDDLDIQNSVLSQFPISHGTNFTLLNLPNSNNTNLSSGNPSVEEKYFNVEKNITSLKETKSEIKLPIETSKSYDTLTESKVLKAQSNGHRVMSENTSKISSDIQLEDLLFTPLGEESKASVEVLQSNEPLHVVPLYFERVSEAPKYFDFNTVPDANNIKPIIDDISERMYSSKRTAQQVQNNQNKNITYFPLSIEYIANTPYRDFGIYDEVSNAIPVGYDSNNAFTYKFNSENVTDGLFQNAESNNDYEFSPSLEYIDLPYPELGNNDHRTFHSVKDQLEKGMRLINTNKTLFQNVRELDNGYDLSLPHEYTDTASDGNIGNNEQGQIIVSGDALDTDFLDQLYSSNITVEKLQNVADNTNGYLQSQPVEYVEFIPSREYNHNVHEPSHIPNNNFVVDAIDEFEFGNENLQGFHDSASSNIEKLTFNNKYIDFMHYGDSINSIKTSDAEGNPISDTVFVVSDYGDLPLANSDVNNLVLFESN